MAEGKEYLLSLLARLRGHEAVIKNLGLMRDSMHQTGTAATQAGSGLELVGQKSTQMVKKTKKGVQETEKISKRFKEAKGSFQTYSRTIIDQGKKSEKVIESTSQSWRKMAKAQKAANKSAKKGKTYQAQLVKALKRVAIVVPVWMAFRAVLRGIMSHIRMVTTALLDLDEAMARLKTVTHGSTQDIERDLTSMRKMILDTSIQTRASIKELGEAFYFLKTSNLEVNEAMAAFLPTVHAMIGTGNNAKDTARAIAGMYNTMGKSLGDNLTVTEKFTKIADILTYTYSTQDVQLDELIEGYTKLAPYLTGISDSFEDMVTMLGFLNTRLLRSGRTGRLTGRAILQLTKNAEQAARVFGITFDPDKPINFLETIGMIAERMKDSTKLTAEQSQALQEVFATRGGVSVRILVEHFDDLNEAMKLARDDAGGFAKKMHEIKMDTVRGQIERMKNTFIVLEEAFLTTITGTTNFKDALKEMNKTLAESVLGVVGLTVELQVLAHNALIAAKMVSLIGAPESLELLSMQRKLQDVNKELDSATQELRDYIKEQAKLSKTTVELEADIVFTTLNTNLSQLREEQAKLQKRISELTFQSPALERNIVVDRYMRRQGRIADIIADQVKEEQELNKTKEEGLKILQKEQNQREIILTRMKTLGASELQIELQRLNFMKESLSTEEEIRKQKIKTAQIALQSLQKEANLVTNLALQYHQADMFERERIRRRIELRGRTPEQLATLFQDSAFDRRVIEEGWGTWGEAAEREIAKVISRMYDLDVSDVLEELEARHEALQLPTEDITSFWDFYKQEGKKTIAEVFAEFAPVGEEMARRTINVIYPEDYLKQMPEYIRKLQTVVEPTAKPIRKEIVNNVEVYTNVEIPLMEIEAQLTSEQIGEAVKEKVIEQIDRQEVIKKIRDEI